MSRVRQTIQQKAHKQVPQGTGVHAGQGSPKGAMTKSAINNSGSMKRKTGNPRHA